MPIRILNETLYASDGTKLKTLSCPKQVKGSKLQKRNDDHFLCGHCERSIVNTDILEEDELIAILRENPDTCVYINRMNPLFSGVQDV